MSSKSTPLFSTPRAKCPVCHQPVYSRAGVHPQCAVRREDGERKKLIAPAIPAAPQSTGESDS